MKFRHGVASAFVGMALLAAGASQAQERWVCEMKGDWSEIESGEKGRFNWNVNWVAQSSDWKLTGRAAESLGRSDLNGRCGDNTCQLRQTYTSGDLKGETFHWRGRYTETFPNENTSVLKFQGDWGGAPKQVDGKWTAQGRCTRG